MELDANKLMENAIRDGLREGIKDKLKQTYNNPLDKITTEAISRCGEEYKSMLGDALNACMNDKEFRQEIAVAVRHTLSKTLVARFGGELERQVNALKSDPATRARITLAIEEIVKTKRES